MTAYQRWQEGFARLKLSERRLIFIATAVLFPYLSVLFLLEPGWQQLQQQQRQLRQAVDQFQALEQQSSQLLERLQLDPNQQIKAQLADEQQRQADLSLQIRQLTGRYVGPEQMLTLLRDVLQQSPGVQLLRLNSQIPQPIQLVNAAMSGNEAVAAGQSSPLLYRHLTVLVFQGDYQRLQQFLQKLEALPWQLHWRELHYQVTQHPTAELTLQLETISEQADYVRI